MQGIRSYGLSMQIRKFWQFVIHDVAFLNT